MKIVLGFLFLSLKFISFSQYWASDYFDKKSIKENHLFKSIEYDFEDSIQFFKKFPNGNYTIFNYKGEIIEKNFYTSRIDENDSIISSWETKKIFIYNPKGEKTTIVMTPNVNDYHISTAYFEYTDTIENKLITHDLTTGDIKKKEKQNKKNFSEKIETEKYSKEITFENIDKKDTVSIKTTYFSFKLKDSIVEFYPQTSLKIIEKFRYSENKKTFYEKYLIYNDQILNSVELKYASNQLPTEIWYCNYKDNKLIGKSHCGIKYVNRVADPNIIIIKKNKN